MTGPDRVRQQKEVGMKKRTRKTLMTRAHRRVLLEQDIIESVEKFGIRRVLSWIRYDVLFPFGIICAVNKIVLSDLAPAMDRLEIEMLAAFDRSNYKKPRRKASNER